MVVLIERHKANRETKQEQCQRVIVRWSGGENGREAAAEVGVEYLAGVAKAHEC